MFWTLNITLSHSGDLAARMVLNATHMTHLALSIDEINHSMRHIQHAFSLNLKISAALTAQVHRSFLHLLFRSWIQQCQASTHESIMANSYISEVQRRPPILNIEVHKSSLLSLVSPFLFPLHVCPICLLLHLRYKDVSKDSNRIYKKSVHSTYN